MDQLGSFFEVLLTENDFKVVPTFDSQRVILVLSRKIKKKKQQQNYVIPSRLLFFSK